MTEAVEQHMQMGSRVRGARQIRWPVVLSTALLVLFLAAALVAPTPFDPTAPNSAETLDPPSRSHWFGTDRLGFDVLSRTIAAGRVDLSLAMAGTLLSVVVGTGLGLAAGARSRWSERMMRVVDIFQAFPLLVLAIVLVALTGNSLRNVVIAIALVNTPRFIRLVRSKALVLREERFVEAVRAIGSSGWRILYRHILPNTAGLILSQASVAIGQAIVVIAGLSFLGIGIVPPTPSWGAMIRSGSSNIATGHWWVSAFPSLAVFFVVISFNTLADAFEPSRTAHGRRPQR